MESWYLICNYSVNFIDHLGLYIFLGPLPGWLVKTLDVDHRSQNLL